LIYITLPLRAMDSLWEWPMTTTYAPTSPLASSYDTSCNT
jgi:hypothetical protein